MKKRGRTWIEMGVVMLCFSGMLLLAVLSDIGGKKAVWENRIVASREQENCTVIVDSGHGGIDPGKVGVGKVLEKDINLAIGNKVYQELKKRGISVLATRQSDEGLYHEEDRNKKVADLQARVRMINGCKARLAVSIHQNSYQSEEVHGPQVFYYGQSKEGERAGRMLQEELGKVSDCKKRQAKANETYYLLKRTIPATVIVECGFLSNPKEAELLRTKAYQDRIVQAICDGIESYLAV